jgi:hypothetical protein
VGHSLGTVVAYNVLRSGRKVPLYVTVGSPLGIRATRKTLSPIENPIGNKGWYNAYDGRDVVALYPLDMNNFDVPTITNNGGVQRRRQDGSFGILIPSGSASKVGLS